MEHLTVYVLTQPCVSNNDGRNFSVSISHFFPCIVLDLGIVSAVINLSLSLSLSLSVCLSVCLSNSDGLLSNAKAMYVAIAIPSRSNGRKTEREKEREGR